MSTHGSYTPLLNIAETVLNVLLLWCIFPHSDICLSNSLASYHLIYCRIHFWFLYLSRYPWKSVGISISITACIHRCLFYQPPFLCLNCCFPDQIQGSFWPTVLGRKRQDQRTQLWLATAFSCFCFHLYIGTSDNIRWDWEV